MKNAHLWKRVLNEGVRKQAEAISDVCGEQFENAIIKAPIIVTPLVPADDLVGEKSQPPRNIGLPFERFWMEGTIDVRPFAQRWGALVITKRTASGWNTCWFIVSDTERGVVFDGGLMIPLDEQGNPGTPTGGLYAPDEPSAENWVTKEGRFAFARIMTRHAVRTLEVLGCKNVSLQSHPSDPALVRRAEKRCSDTPHSYRYYTLVVRPAGSNVPSVHGIDLGTMPLHVCRGHFSEYGPEFNKGLLFGKYSGRFFIPPHLRGKKENGIVEKDYSVSSSSSVGSSET